MFCLPVEYLENIKQAIRDGKFSVDNFNKLKTSQERRDMLAKIVGKEYAEQVNTILEKKLLLVNQEKGIYDAIREITGLSAQDKADLTTKIKARIAERTRRLYNPADDETMLNELTSDIYSKKYGIEVSLEQAQQITELAQDVKEAKDLITDFTKITPESLKYGEAKVALDNYTGTLKQNINTRNLVNPLKVKGIGGKIEANIENARISANFIGATTRALVAGLADNSFFGNQGAAVLMDPKYYTKWQSAFIKSLSDIGKTLMGGVSKGDAIIDGAKAMTYAEPNYLNGRYENKGGAKLDIWKGEEEIPTSVIYKVPILRRFAKTADVAYEVGAVRLRTELANQQYKMFESSGSDMTDKDVIGNINKTVNSMTGRGDIGSLAKSGKEINIVFFSIRYLKSTWDVGTAHLFDPNMSPKMKFTAALSLLRILAVAAVIIGVANTIKKGTVELNPISSDFTKVKVGNARIGIPFITKLASIITLISRIATQKTKSSTTGIITPLGSGYGQTSGMDVFWNFTENKLSPLLGIIKDFASQSTFEGGKPTILGELKGAVTPMGISGTSEIWSDKSNGVLLKIIATALNYMGVNVQVYAPSSVDWTQDPGVELQKFREKVGEEEFKKANDLYNKLVSERIDDQLNAANKDSDYRALSEDEKKALILEEKARIKQEIFDSYDFKYEKANSTTDSTKKQSVMEKYRASLNK